VGGGGGNCLTEIEGGALKCHGIVLKTERNFKIPLEVRILLIYMEGKIPNLIFRGIYRTSSEAPQASLRIFYILILRGQSECGIDN
jgi:hypothetical protein